MINKDILLETIELSHIALIESINQSEKLKFVTNFISKFGSYVDDDGKISDKITIPDDVKINLEKLEVSELDLKSAKAAYKKISGN